MANPSRLEKIQITGNTNSGTATKVNVQEANGEVNTQTINTGFNKNIGLGGSDIVGANTLLNQYATTPVDWTAQSYVLNSVVFYGGKQWISKTTTVADNVPSVSSKWEEITFEALANKTTTVDQTIIDGSTNAVSSNAVFDGLALKSNIGHTHVASQITDLSKASVGLGNVDNTSDLSKPLSTATINALATKAPISSVHNPVTIGTANGLSLSTQQLSLGLASSGVTGALSGTDWNTFNGKFNTPTGLATNYLPKWNGSGFGNSTWQEFAGGRLSNTGSDDLTNKLQVNGSGRFSGELSTNNSKLVLRDDSIENHSTDSDDASIVFNVFGFNKGSTRFRNVRIFDGKGNPFVFFSGQNKEMIMAGTISASPATTANQVPTWGQVQAAARPYKVYTALLSQTGTSAPTATVLENTLGGTVVWSRNTNGVYYGTLTGAFAVDKTGIISTSSFSNIFVSAIRGDSNFVIIRTSTSGALSDTCLTNTIVEIRVYL